MMEWLQSLLYPLKKFWGRLSSTRRRRIFMIYLPFSIIFASILMWILVLRIEFECTSVLIIFKDTYFHQGFNVVASISCLFSHFQVEEYMSCMKMWSHVPVKMCMLYGRYWLIQIVILHCENETKNPFPPFSFFFVDV